MASSRLTEIHNHIYDTLMKVSNIIIHQKSETMSPIPSGSVLRHFKCWPPGKALTLRWVATHDIMMI